MIRVGRTVSSVTEPGEFLAIVSMLDTVKASLPACLSPLFFDYFILGAKGESGFYYVAMAAS